MSVWDVPRTDQLPAGCSPALWHGMDVQAGRGLMVPHHDDHFGMFYFPHPPVACTHHDRSACFHGAAGRKSTSKFSLYFLTQADISAHEVMFTPKSLLIGPLGPPAPTEARSASNAGLPRLRAVPWRRQRGLGSAVSNISARAIARGIRPRGRDAAIVPCQPRGACICVSCGVRAHAQLPAVDLKSTPLTTRAN